MACNYAFAVSLKRCKRQVFSVGRYVGLLVPSQPYLDELSITFETSDRIFGAGPWPYILGMYFGTVFFGWWIDLPHLNEAATPEAISQDFPYQVWQDFRYGYGEPNA